MANHPSNQISLPPMSVACASRGRSAAHPGSLLAQWRKAALHKNTFLTAVARVARATWRLADMASPPSIGCDKELKDVHSESATAGELSGGLAD